MRDGSVSFDELLWYEPSLRGRPVLPLVGDRDADGVKGAAEEK
jgi:hypothetical protein